MSIPILNFQLKIGYRVLTAAGGRQAIEVCQAAPAEIDMVVLDVVMPELGGGGPYCALSTSCGRLQTEWPLAGRTF